MITLPEISVIVPVYKVEPYLRRCVDSILAQTFTDFELILVDDGSPDNCPAICDEYAEKDDRVHVIHQENGGLSAARNAGMEIACGKYYLFCDSDDYVSPCWCETLYKQIEKTPDAWIYCDIVRVDDGDPIKETSTMEICAKYTDYYTAFRQGLSGYSVNKIYSSEVLKCENIRFDEQQLFAEDIDFTLKYLSCCKSCIYLPVALYFYLQRQGSLLHAYVPDWFSKHLSPFYHRIPFIREEHLPEYCDTWLYQFLTFFPIVFDKRNPAPWFKKIAYNQRMLSSKEFQFCLRHASGKNENPIIIKILKTKCYLLYWLFDKAVSLRHRK